MDSGQLKQASVTPGFRQLASSSSLPGEAHPDSLSDGKRQFTPQASESRNRPPRLTWSRSGISKSGHYPAPCGAVQGEHTPKKITSVSPGGASLGGVPWTLHQIHRPVRIQLTPVIFFNQRIDRRPAPHAPGDEEEKQECDGDELLPVP